MNNITEKGREPPPFPYPANAVDLKSLRRFFLHPKEEPAIPVFRVERNKGYIAMANTIYRKPRACCHAWKIWIMISQICLEFFGTFSKPKAVPSPS